MHSPDAIQGGLTSLRIAGFCKANGPETGGHTTLKATMVDRMSRNPLGGCVLIAINSSKLVK